jgi:hypothetical protein
MRSEIWHNVHRLHGEGLSSDGIARMLGMRRHKVDRLLLESGALRRQYEYGIRDFKLLEQYREGETQRDICQRHSVPISVLQKILRVHAEPKRPRRQPLDPDMVREVAADYLDSDLTREEICASHGISESVLNRILEEQDIPRRTPPSTQRRNGNWESPL